MQAGGGLGVGRCQTRAALACRGLCHIDGLLWLVERGGDSLALCVTGVTSPKPALPGAVPISSLSSLCCVGPSPRMGTGRSWIGPSDTVSCLPLTGTTGRLSTKH